ncbi:MAG TPA: hypothetical protein VFV38_24075 [Ktedonobacteraceae bacterium]|nr:hypothetical protein [Ktedonobacteraceae bacterium]
MRGKLSGAIERGERLDLSPVTRVGEHPGDDLCETLPIIGKEVLAGALPASQSSEKRQRLFSLFRLTEPGQPLRLDGPDREGKRIVG